VISKRYPRSSRATISSLGEHVFDISEGYEMRHSASEAMRSSHQLLLLLLLRHRGSVVLASAGDVIARRFLALGESAPRTEVFAQRT
jgi:hypothetical protein